MERSDRQLVNLYLDGELSEEDSRLLTEKLGRDAALAAYLQDLESLATASRNLPGWPAPPVRMTRTSSLASLLQLRFEVPVAAVAAAALLLLGIFLGRGPLSNPLTAPQAEKLVAYRVIYYSPDAQSVSVVGDFNGWRQEVPLQRQGDSGYWTDFINLSPGKHTYSLIVDGKNRVADPTADFVVDDGFGSKNSVVRIGL